MKIKKYCKMLDEGHSAACLLGLGLSKDNWTPLLIYIHFTRLLIGFLVGAFLGITAFILILL